jgi:hypothetical protein
LHTRRLIMSLTFFRLVSVMDGTTRPLGAIVW